VQEQTYPLTEVVQEGDVLQNDVHKDEKVWEMVTSQPNLKDQQSIDKL
jgi:hypothetical protein